MSEPGKITALNPEELARRNAVLRQQVAVWEATVRQLRTERDQLKRRDKRQSALYRAEQALRPAVIARKLFKCSKNSRGANTFAAFASATRTIRQRRGALLDDLLTIFATGSVPAPAPLPPVGPSLIKYFVCHRVRPLRLETIIIPRNGRIHSPITEEFEGVANETCDTILDCCTHGCALRMCRRRARCCVLSIASYAKPQANLRSR